MSHKNVGFIVLLYHCTYLANESVGRVVLQENDSHIPPNRFRYSFGCYIYRSLVRLDFFKIFVDRNILESCFKPDAVRM